MALAREHERDAVSRLTVFARTPPRPSLPLITSGGRSAADQSRLRTVIAEALADRETEPLRLALHLSGVEILDEFGVRRARCAQAIKKPRGRAPRSSVSARPRRARVHTRFRWRSGFAAVVTIQWNALVAATRAGSTASLTPAPQRRRSGRILPRIRRVDFERQAGVTGIRPSRDRRQAPQPKTAKRSRKSYL